MNEIQKIEPGIVGQIIRAEADAQVALAGLRPRDLDRFEGNVRALVTRSPEVAAEMLYAIPRDGKLIEGPSVRFAEVLVAYWGNSRSGARIIEEGPESITAQGTFHDLENNNQITFEVRRRIVDKKGRRYSPDMINTTANAACAIALRNAITRGIPKPAWEGLYQAAREASNASRNPPELRKQALLAFQGIGVDEPRILNALELKSAEEITIDHIAKLRGLFAAIREGETTTAEAFPIERPQAEAPSTLEAFGNNANPKTPPYSRQPNPLTDVESAATAHEMGRGARRKNASRTQWPGRWRDQSNIEAWLAGWDAENADIAKNEGKN